MLDKTAELSYSTKFEECALDRLSLKLWIPLPIRLVLMGVISQLCHFYYRFKGAYSNSEERVINYVAPEDSTTKKIAIVTGSNTGIGFETARMLGKAGYKVIMACRNQSKAEAAITKLLAENPESDLEFMELELSSFSSIRRFAKNFQDKEDRLDLLINNAGIMVLPTFQLTEDDNEMQYQVNYLSTYLLIRLLIKKIRSTKGSKIINLSSMAHYCAGDCDFSTVNTKEFYSPYANYCLSKAALVMMTYSLQKKLSEFDVEVYAVHPGIVQTELLRYQGFLYIIADFLGKFFIKSPLEGALTVLRLAILKRQQVPYSINSTVYFSDDLVMQPLALTKNEAKQDALWDETSKILCLDPSL